jgi:spore germination protein GerM
VIRSQRGGQVWGRSTGRGWGGLLAAILVVCAGGALWWLLDIPWRSRTAVDTMERGGNVTPGEEFTIWFASPQEDALVSETQRVLPNLTRVERAKASLQALITGPKSGALRTLSAEVKIRELFIDDRGTAYIDFNEALSRDHPGGTWSAMLTIRSIMQTLVANVPEIKQVQILIEGHAVDTLAGHLDIRRPIGTTSVMNQP